MSVNEADVMQHEDVEKAVDKHESPKFNLQKFDNEENGGEVKAEAPAALYESM